MKTQLKPRHLNHSTITRRLRYSKHTGKYPEVAKQIEEAGKKALDAGKQQAFVSLPCKPPARQDTQQAFVIAARPLLPQSAHVPRAACIE